MFDKQNFAVYDICMFNIMCETSMRHVHLSQEDLEKLFGSGAKLIVDRPLSQPGQFLAKQRVTLIGPKREIENVGIIGPVRKETQVEISRTDAFSLGLKDVPIRQSGDTKGAPTLMVATGETFVNGATIVAKRHLHLTPAMAKQHNIVDGQIVKIQFDGDRSGILGSVVARVDKSYDNAVHIDSDEANAMLAGKECVVLVD